MVAIFAGQMLTDQPVTINGDGEQVRDFVCVGDCAQANLPALLRGYGAGIYNLVTGTGASVNEVFRTLKAITGYRREPIHGPAKLGRPGGSTWTPAGPPANSAGTRGRGWRWVCGPRCGTSRNWRPGRDRRPDPAAGQPVWRRHGLPLNPDARRFTERDLAILGALASGISLSAGEALTPARRKDGGERALVGVALARPAGSVPSGWPRTKGSAKEEGEP